jgi:hypothetical protein
MSDTKRYVDADDLLLRLQTLSTYASANNNGCYSSDTLTQAINQKIENAISGALQRFKMDLINAVMTSAKPYSQCMLCVRRDCDDRPPNLS